eukprot:NODE_384_length_9596_cov_0.282510.p2 type:complete len:468 gc:universal NODE_384_length_9596_cov_0.282510:8398-6995(-)
MNNSTLSLGDYQLIETLGIGSFGKVRLAIHQPTGIKVALKFINRQLLKSKDMHGRVKREIEFLLFLNHPHIIKLYTTFITSSDIVMVMEVADGELFDLIVKNGKMNESMARGYFQQIMSAVEYCHRHCIVHRDLKPENILLVGDMIRIVDFGLSQVIKDGEFLKTSCGSPNYAAPEVISGKYYAGPEVDIWSCGVILYVMLVGRLPFDDESIPNLFQKINSGVFVIPSFLSPGSADLLKRMLVVDPLKRMNIKELRETEWFNTSLPDYLQPLPDVQEFNSEILDENAINQLILKLNVEKDVLVNALKGEVSNPVTVAYQLVRDNNRVYADPTRKDISVRRLVNIQNRETTGPTLEVLSGTLIQLPKQSTVRSKWHVGIRSRSTPLQILYEIYKSISKLPMTWKSLDPFAIRVRYIYHNLEIKVDLQLYSVDVNYYLLDFKAVHPTLANVMGFFEACCLIITELAING